MRRSSPSHRLDVQALRGVAVLLVVVYHAQLGLPGGFVGVDVFFVISGFVIAGLIKRQLTANDGLDFRDFYARRARRLLPALAVTTLATLAISILVLAPNGTQQNAAKTAAAASAFSGNLYLYRFGVDYFRPGNLNPFLHTWSLGVEEQVYLIVPALLVLLWRFGRRTRSPERTVLIGVVGGTMASFVFAALMTLDRLRLVPMAAKFAFYSPVTRLWEFGIGVLVALLPTDVATKPRTARVLIGLGVVTLATVALRYDTSTPFPGLAAVPPVFGTALIILAGSLSREASRTITLKPLVWLGDRSYGWYLWHWPFIVFAGALWPSNPVALLIAATLSLPFTAYFFHAVEQRFRYDSSLVGLRALGLASVCITAPLLLAGFTIVGANSSWWSTELRDRKMEAQRSEAERDGCDLPLRTSPCQYGHGSSKITLIGDSHAGTIADVVKNIALEQEATFQIWTRPGCPFGTSVGDDTDNWCRKWSSEVVDFLTTNPSDIVIVHVNSTSYAGLVAESATNHGLGGVSSTSAGVDRYIDRLSEALGPIADVGSRIIIVEDVPIFTDSRVQLASLLNKDPRPSTRFRLDVDRQTKDLDIALERLAKELNLGLVDPRDFLCDPEACSQIYAGEWIYRDSDHLSPHGAARLGIGLRAVLDGQAE